MKAYIDKLVAKVITHCPEALANDEDDEFKSSIEWGKMWHSKIRSESVGNGFK